MFMQRQSDGGASSNLCLTGELTRYRTESNQHVARGAMTTKKARTSAKSRLEGAASKAMFRHDEPPVVKRLPRGRLDLRAEGHGYRALHHQDEPLVELQSRRTRHDGMFGEARRRACGAIVQALRIEVRTPASDRVHPSRAHWTARTELARVKGVAGTPAIVESCAARAKGLLRAQESLYEPRERTTNVRASFENTQE